jgi:hypothetical protein
MPAKHEPQGAKARMNIIKRLLGGSAGPAGDNGLYYYLKSDQNGQIIRVRINPANDLSQLDEGSGYYVRKVVVGSPSYVRMELELTLDRERKVVDAQVKGGKLVDEAAYEEYTAANAGQ